MVEMMARDADHLAALVLASLGAAVPAPPSLTFAALSIVAYVREGINLRYVSQAAHAVTLTGADGHYWVAVHCDTFTAVSGWTRQPGTHYLWRASAAHPGNPLAGLTFLDVTVAGGVIMGSTLLLQVLGPPMSQQLASDVAITGGTAVLRSLSVDSPTLVVDPVSHGVGMGIPPSAPWALRVQNAEVVGGFVVDNPTLTVDPAANSVGFGVAPAAPWALRAQNIEVIGGLIVDVNTLWVDPILNCVGFGVTPIAGRSLAALNAYIGTMVTGPSPNLPGTTSQMVWHTKNATNGLTVAPIDNNTGPGAAVLFWNASGGAVGTIYTNAVATSYNTTSDGRLKTAVQTLTGELDLLRLLRPVSFRWLLDDSPGVGFLAHEVAEVIGGVITGEADAVDEQGGIVPQMIDASKLVPYLVGAVKSLVERVEALQARLEVLEDALGV
jgi:hypothetical protein